MIELLLMVKEEVDNSEDSCVRAENISYYEDLYNEIISDGYRKNPTLDNTGKRSKRKKTKILCLLDRMKNYQKDILRFMIELEVPFDNNLAERDLRKSKVRQKISGTFRNIERAREFFNIRSYISTLLKLGINIFDGIKDCFHPDFNIKFADL